MKRITRIKNFVYEFYLSMIKNNSDNTYPVYLDYPGHPDSDKKISVNEFA